MNRVMRKRSLVNSGKRKRRRSLRNMSPKQIKYFGTPAQKAALKHTRKRRRTTNAGKRHVVRRVSRKRTKVRRRRARRNVGAIYSIGLAALGGNPGKRRRRARRRKVTHSKRRNTGGVKKMARRRRRVAHHRRRRNAPKVHVVYRSRRRRSYRRRRANSGYRRRRAYNGRPRRRRNAGRAGGYISGTGSNLKNAFAIIGGGVLTRIATQAALGSKNTGIFGYLGNAVAAFAIGWAANKILKNRGLANMVTIGGFVGLAFRLLQDFTPLGQYVNLQLSGAGKSGDVGIGMITDSTFFVPTVFQNGSMTNANLPAQVLQLAAAGSSRQGMGTLRRRRLAA